MSRTPRFAGTSDTSAVDGLLGLHLHTDTIHLVVTAERGTLLGNLLCGLFFGNPTGAATALNQLLRQGMITL